MPLASFHLKDNIFPASLGAPAATKDPKQLGMTNSAMAISIRT